MPPTTPSPIITPDAIRRLLMQGGDPSSMMSPDPSQPQPPSPAPGAPSVPGAPGATPAAAPSGMIAQSFQAPEDKSQYLTEHPVALPARPTGDFDTGAHPALRHILGSLFAGMSEFGRPGTGSAMAERWMGQESAKRQYDQNLPAVRQAAENTAYDQYLGQGAKAGDIQKSGAEIEKSGAETGLVKAQTGNIAMNPPGKAEFLKELQQRRSAGTDDPQQLFNEYAVRAPYAHATRQEILDVIKNTPVKPFNFEMKEGAILPGSYLGHTYGPVAGENEPAEIASARNNALASIKQGQTGKVAVARAEGQARAAIQAGTFGQPGDPMVDMVGQGRVDLATALQRVPPQAKEAFMSSLSANYQDYNQGTYGIAKNVGEAFTAGDQGKQLTAISTAREHMKTFQQLAEALDNSDVQVLNRLGNAFGVQFGNDKATNFKIAAQAFGGEVGKAFDGAGVTEGERKSAQAAFNPNMSPQQFKGAIKTVDALLAGKQKSLKESFDSGSQGKPNFGTQPSVKPGVSAEGPTATGPNGHKIKVVGGKWVDAATGQPIQ